LIAARSGRWRISWKYRVNLTAQRPTVGRTRQADSAQQDRQLHALSICWTATPFVLAAGRPASSGLCPEEPGSDGVGFDMLKADR
jgi:hypothetical protein